MKLETETETNVKQTSRGIKASRPVVGNGMWVTSLLDPDGYRIEFESCTDVPEDTEFSEHEE